MSIEPDQTRCSHVKKSEIFGWCTFDFANSAYTTIIITVCFNVIFTHLIVGPDSKANYATGNFLWSVTLSISWLLCALVGPLFGAMSDASHGRKWFLGASVGLCSLTTAGLFLVTPDRVVLAAVLVILSNLGFSLSENFISSFLPHIATPSNIGKISGLAWGLGYFGGLGSILICHWATGFVYTPENFDSLRLIGPITAGFFVVGALPTFLFLREPTESTPYRGATNVVCKAYSRLRGTFCNIRRYKDLARFLTANFFFQGGIAIVISFTALYADQIVGISGRWQAALFISLQVSAALGAFFFGWLWHRIGAIAIINITLFVWIATGLMIYFLPQLGHFIGTKDLKPLFVLIGNIAGLCLGATQSCARALVGIFSPPEKSGEFFGFWGFSGKLAAVCAIVLFGWLQKSVRIENAILLCSLFFGLGLFLNWGVDEKRGRALAMSWADN